MAHQHDARSDSSKQRQRAFKLNPQPASAKATQTEPTTDKALRRKFLRLYIQWLWPYRFALSGVFALALAAAA